MILVPLIENKYSIYESVEDALKDSDTYIVTESIKYENGHVEIDGIIVFNEEKKQRKYHVIRQNYEFVFIHEETNME